MLRISRKKAFTPSPSIITGSMDKSATGGDSEVTFKKTTDRDMGSTQSHNGEADHDETIVNTQHDDSTKTKVVYEPMSEERMALQNLRDRYKKLKQGSMEALFCNLEIKMKEDNLKVLDRLNDVSLNTATCQSSIATLRTEHDELCNQLESTQKHQDVQQVKINDTSREVRSTMDRLSILEGIVERQAQEISLLRSHNEYVATKGMENSIYIQNLDEVPDEDDAATYEELTTFFTNTMLITQNLPIIKASRQGKSTPRSIHVILGEGGKKIVYDHVKNLKNKVNSANKPFFVSDQLPAGKQAEKRRQRDVVKRVKNIPPADRPSISYKGGNLFLNNIKFRGVVPVPDSYTDINPGK